MTDYTQSDGGVLLPNTGIHVSGAYQGTLIRDGKIIEEFEDSNLVVNEGLNSILGVYFHADTQITAWYLGVYEANYTPVASVTAATITAASTENTTYASATRPVFTPAAAASQSITNSASRASFIFNATKTIYGAFLVSASAKSATTGTLFSAALFSSSKAVVNGDELLLTYTFTASSV